MQAAAYNGAWSRLGQVWLGQVCVTLGLDLGQVWVWVRLGFGLRLGLFWVRLGFGQVLVIADNRITLFITIKKVSSKTHQRCPRKFNKSVQEKSGTHKMYPILSFYLGNLMTDIAIQPNRQQFRSLQLSLTCLVVAQSRNHFQAFLWFFESASSPECNAMMLMMMLGPSVSTLKKKSAVHQRPACPKNEKRKDIGRYSFFHFFCLLQTLFVKKKGKLKVNHILIYYFFSFIQNTNRKVSNSKSY